MYVHIFVTKIVARIHLLRFSANRFRMSIMDKFESATRSFSSFNGHLTVTPIIFDAPIFIEVYCKDHKNEKKTVKKEEHAYKNKLQGVHVR